MTNLILENSALLPYLVLSLIVACGGFVMFRFFRRNKGRQEISAQNMASSLKRLEQRMNDLQKRIEEIETHKISQRNLERKLENLERQVFSSQGDTSIDKPETLGKLSERTYEMSAKQNRNPNTIQPGVNFSTSSEDYLDNSKIEAAIWVYKQQSSKSGNLFVPLSKYFTELEERKITVDELESRNILDMMARKYPGSVRIEQVRGKPDKQIAILDEYINHQIRQ